MERTRADLREAAALLRRAQRAATEERLWLLTIAWQLLHDLTARLADQQAPRGPVAIDACRDNRQAPH